MQKGFKNEKNFAKVLDNKKVNQLPLKFREIIYTLFKNTNQDSFVECWQSKYFEKADIKIKINNEVKGISIKTGKYCSMHQETIYSLYPFFKKIGIEENIIKKFDKYLQGYVNGKRVDAVTYTFHHYNEIREIFDKLNEYYVKVNLILRFIFQGTEKQNYGCDAIILGTPDNFLWATKDEILDYLIKYPKQETIYLKFSALNIKSYDRNLKNNLTKKAKQNEIQVKWYTIKDDLEIIEKAREKNRLKS